ncbi:autotransporter assembly complex protein TamA [Allosphingosinicella indica]|uniref:Autotransporter secretion outer membrane protein TamA n=1 Tax=Allosphingosinicella indica TaxID=941907 RepID=A0A1X7G1H3_9SPHN|nr:BamA/TamA family outer membrane protein [Allosphingosinicella indica]SMF61847.1 autotransporter secretion outer membrane protein TamA [Allosphingosinicella indica]
MDQVEAGRLVAAGFAAVALLSFSGTAAAQTADPFQELEAPLDPSAPLDPLPDLGVDWPDMEERPDDGIPDLPDTSIADAATERSYAVAVSGLESADVGGLMTQFRALSTLEQNKDDPANAAQIDRRAREDAELLAELLRAYGYYDALVRTRVEPGSTANHLSVRLEVEPGPVYRFAEVELPGIDAAGQDAAALREAFGVRADDAVNAASVEAGEAALRAELGKRGYAFAEVGALDVAVDHDTRTAALVLPVDPNGARQFGGIRVEGTPLFDARHISRIARFKPGDPYRADRLEDLRRALVQTGIVSSVALRPVDNPETKAVDLAVALEPAPMRTIAGGAGYGTGEGLRVEGSWQHRNLIPPEGAVTLRGVLGTREQLLSANLRRSNFRKRDQVLTAQAAVSHIDRNAYDARSVLIGAGIERQTNIIWQKVWTWSLGADLIATDERDVDLDSGMQRRRTFFIAALPSTLSYDGSNDLLDPTTGFRLSGRISPEMSLQGSPFGYVKGQVDGSFYYPATERVTIAGRARLGTILGASRDRIAPSRRFYAGGGGSVRGFGYQSLGPRDPVFDDPVGGRSLAEFALEARIRVDAFNDSLGIVPFIDAGNIYTSAQPRIDDLRFGAGIGVRYHTRFGPIRVDVGTPLSKRSGDARVAVYVSLGQAF